MALSCGAEKTGKAGRVPNAPSLCPGVTWGKRVEDFVFGTKWRRGCVSIWATGLLGR
jgi:hypothetical protein